MLVRHASLYATFAVLSCLSISCANSDNPPVKKEGTDTSIIKEKTYVGNYVTEEYFKRSQGYDWVAFKITYLTDSSINISVRSRADKKKPTCRFDATAFKVSENIFKTNQFENDILFVFSHNALTIEAENSKNNSILYYYCSGGASLAGTYRKLSEPLDHEQIDSTVFQKLLTLQNISFEITTKGEGSLQELTLQPFGLKTDNSKFTTQIEGNVTDAEIGDLNMDGFPEVLIYTRSAGSGSYAQVMGFSVNNGKSMSQISFPNIQDNPKANEGYMGHDEFALVENTLVQRFRIYKEGDTNNKPTGNYRQIQYKMKNGEASRKFVVDKIIEFPAK